MDKIRIRFEQLNINAIAVWQGQGLLLTCGDYSTGEFNTMTVGWGSIGVMWSLPFIQVVVRPVRYTYQFMEKFDTFTVTSFSEEYAPALHLLGNTSGRDGDKIKRSGLIPSASSLIPSPGFEQAQLTFECRKIYWDDMEKTKFLDPRLEKKYPAKDYHRIFYGEILSIYGDPKYQQ